MSRPLRPASTPNHARVVKRSSSMASFSAARLLSLDEQLYDLSTTAPDEERAQLASQLRSRVAGLVEAMGADTATGPDASVDDLRTRRAAVWHARTELRNFLDATAPGARPPAT